MRPSWAELGMLVPAGHKSVPFLSLHRRDWPICLTQALEKARPILVDPENGGFVIPRTMM